MNAVFSFVCEAYGDRLARTCCRAFAAADAFGGVWFGYRIDVHRTDIPALAARDAAGVVDMHAVQADLVEQSVDRAEWAHDLAEKPAAYDAAEDSDDEDRGFEDKEPAELRSEFGMCQEQWNAAFEGPGRADVFAERRRTEAKLVGHHGRHQEHEHHEQYVFDVSQRFRYADVRRRDLVQEFLDESKRAYEPADGSSEHHAQRQDESQSIEPHAELPVPSDCLHRADWARQSCRRTRVAVDAGVAEVLPAAFVDLPGLEVTEVAIGKTERCYLYDLAPDVLTDLHGSTPDQCTQGRCAPPW